MRYVSHPDKEKEAQRVRYMSHSAKEKKTRRARYMCLSEKEKEAEKARYMSRSSEVKRYRSMPCKVPSKKKPINYSIVCILKSDGLQ